MKKFVRGHLSDLLYQLEGTAGIVIPSYAPYQCLAGDIKQKRGRDEGES